MISNSSPVCSEPQPSAGLNSPPRQTGLMDLLQKTREQKRRLLLASTAAQDARRAAEQENAEVKAENAQLKAENAQLKAENTQLQEAS